VIKLKLKDGIEETPETKAYLENLEKIANDYWLEGLENLFAYGTTNPEHIAELKKLNEVMP
jgi:hypothetical protein